MLPEGLPTTRDLLDRREWRGPTLPIGNRLAEPPPTRMPPRSDVDAFAVEWQVATGPEAGR